ncbi:uncharacterized PurR-regulated membrane protein YhhQ (DUF165 family) [Kutzneria kofuensis]|uniref:Uncharacterized PurR-regulated membrane protein YhhQ (DUF165 family) n=1 Tax=Kutzneria kofuensis TaxID=103725 RepID=A0A7W9KDV2_9PSEU|nr:uncharacterized PurR-regulated membrane protein YhhQ (DUF165 family) [Kutzneria kofuensis]
MVLVAGYAATIAGANWATTLWPAVTVAGLHIPAGALLAGLAFTVRDLLQDTVGTRTTLLTIAPGAALSGLIAEPRIALASAAASAISESADIAVYTLCADSMMLIVAPVPPRGSYCLADDSSASGFSASAISRGGTTPYSSSGVHFRAVHNACRVSVFI